MRAKQLCPVAFSFLAILTCIPSSAQDSASAKAFLTNIYRHYSAGGKGIEFDGPQSGRYFDSSLLALEKADVKANGPDNVPAVDADPICGCQDWEGIWNLVIDVRIESPQRAIANVSFSLFSPKDRPAGESSKLQFTLVKQNGDWRIWDILDESDPKDKVAVRKLLQDDLASLRHKPAPASR
jgi:hypothetical protein